MAYCLHLGEDVLDLAVRADDEGGTDDAHDFPAIHVFFLQDAELVSDLFVGIGQEGKGQAEFVLKFLLCLGRVGRDAE